MAEAPVRTLICDDEALIRERIRMLIGETPGFEVAGEAADGIEAVSKIESLRPDLVLLDIEMPELNGFEVVAELSSPRPAIVFVTAYDEFALRAFEVHALDYIVKPIDVGRFAQALEHVRERLRSSIPQDWETRLRSLLTERAKQSGALTRLAVRGGGQIVVVLLSRVLWIDAADDGARVHTREGSYELREGLGDLLRKLPPAFVRIHRSTVVNIDAVKGLLPWAHGELVVVVEGGQRLHASRSYANALRSLLNNEPGAI